MYKYRYLRISFQKQLSSGILRKRFSENMQQIYGRTNMMKCDFNKVEIALEITLRHGCSPVNLLHIFRTTFLKNTSGWLLLSFLKLTRDYFLYKAKKGINAETLFL